MTLMHADGRSENGGESVVRAIILELGFAEPDLQVEIEDPSTPAHTNALITIGCSKTAAQLLES